MSNLYVTYRNFYPLAKSRGATYDVVCLQENRLGKYAYICSGSELGIEYKWGYTSNWP